MGFGVGQALTGNFPEKVKRKGGEGGREKF